MVRQNRTSGTWRQLEVLDGAPPAARGGHSMAAIGNAIVLCGGTDRRLSECGHVHLLDFGEKSHSCQCSQLATIQDGKQFTLSRTGFTLVAIDEHVYLFGGQDPESGLCYNDVQRLNPAKNAWQKVATISGKPAPRHAYCAGLVGSHSFAVFGGANQSNEVLSDVWVFNTRTTEWKHVSLEGETPAGREMAAAVSLPDSHILICGGRSATGTNLSDAYVVDFTSSTSRKLTSDPLLARCSHSAALCEVPLEGMEKTKCAVLFGGFVGTGLSQDLVILNVEDGTCTQTDDGKDSAKRPAARFAHAACAVSAGSKQCVYIFGGMGEEADYQDVVSWTPTVGKDDQ